MDPLDSNFGSHIGLRLAEGAVAQMNLLQRRPVLAASRLRTIGKLNYATVSELIR